MNASAVRARVRQVEVEQVGLDELEPPGAGRLRAARAGVRPLEHRRVEVDAR